MTEKSDFFCFEHDSNDYFLKHNGTSQVINMTGGFWWQSLPFIPALLSHFNLKSLTQLFQSVISDCCFVICSSHIQTFALWQIYSKLSPPSACIYISLCSLHVHISQYATALHWAAFNLYTFTALLFIPMHWTPNNTLFLQTLTSLPSANL